ncbi:hypothetical protein D3C78_1251300 [compost metagenome]
MRHLHELEDRRHSVLVVRHVASSVHVVGVVTSTGSHISLHVSTRHVSTFTNGCVSVSKPCGHGVDSLTSVEAKLTRPSDWCCGHSPSPANTTLPHVHLISQVKHSTTNKVLFVNGSYLPTHLEVLKHCSTFGLS